MQLYNGLLREVNIYLPKVCKKKKVLIPPRAFVTQTFGLRDHWLKNYYIKQIDFTLSWVCTTINHRCQDVVRTSVTHPTAPHVPPYLFLPHFDVICDLLLYKPTATWSLFMKQSLSMKRFLILLDLCSFVVEHWKVRSERLEGKSSWRTHDFLSPTLMKTWVTTSFFWNKFHCTVQLLPAIQVDSSWLTWC